MSVRYKINVKFSYDPGAINPCKATVKVTLPAEKKPHGTIHLDPRIQCRKLSISNTPLTQYWTGTLMGSVIHQFNGDIKLQGSETFYASSWDELKKTVEAVIGEIEGTIKEAVEFNKKMVNSIPSDRLLIIDA